MQLTLDELKDENDVIIESQGIKVVYNSDLEEYVLNSEIDYANRWFQRGFVIKGGISSSC